MFAQALQTSFATSRTCTLRARDRRRPETAHNHSMCRDFPTTFPCGHVLCGIRGRKRPEVVRNHSTHTDFPQVSVCRCGASRPWVSIAAMEAPSFVFVGPSAGVKGSVDKHWIALEGIKESVGNACPSPFIACVVVISFVFSLSANLAVGPRK